MTETVAGIVARYRSKEMTVKVVVDKPIFYLVLVGEKDFTINLDRIA